MVYALEQLGIARRSAGESRHLRCKGNKFQDKKGYVYVTPNRNQTKKEHIAVMENFIGRRLEKGEVVHHINNVKSDNRLSNLLLCSNAEHTRIHWEIRKAAGIDIPRQPPKINRVEMMSMYDAGKSVKEIASIMGCGLTIIYRTLQRRKRHATHQ